MDWLLSGLTVLMNILMGRKNKWAWILMIIISILWIFYAIGLAQYGLLPATILNLVIAIPSAKKWFSEAIPEKPKPDPIYWSRDEACPHGFEDWSDCPVCGH